MTKKPNLAARAASLTKQSAGTEEAPAPARTREKPAAAVRTDPIRITLDLAPQAHRQLKALCDEIAAELGRARVPSAEVFRALLSQVEVNPALLEAVKEEIRENSRK